MKVLSLTLGVILCLVANNEGVKVEIARRDIARCRARNSQECINSTTGATVMMAPEVQPGPHQVIGTINGLMFFAFFAFFATHGRSQVPILH